MRPAHALVGGALLLLLLTLSSLRSSPGPVSRGAPVRAEQRGPRLPTDAGWCPSPDAPFPALTPFPTNFWYVKTFKTGSTTLSSVFNSICAHYGVIWVKWEAIKNVSQMSYRGIKPSPFELGFDKAVKAARSVSDVQHVAITSHISYDERASRSFGQPLMRFTSVRHPLSRVHSHFIQTLCYWTAVSMGWRQYQLGSADGGPPGPAACDNGEDPSYFERALSNDTIASRWDFVRKKFQHNLMYWYTRGNAATVEDAADQYDFIFVSERMNEGAPAPTACVSVCANHPTA